MPLIDLFVLLIFNSLGAIGVLNQFNVYKCIDCKEENLWNKENNAFSKELYFQLQKKIKLKISKQLNDFADTFHTVSLLLRTKYNGKIKKRITENRKGLIEFISMHSSKFDRCY